MNSTTSNTIEVDVAIIGGNIIGAATALTLQKIGLSVALIEKNAIAKKVYRANTPYALRVSAIIPVVKNFLQEIGIWQKLHSSRIQEVARMQVWEKDLNHSLQFDQQSNSTQHSSIDQSVAWIIENDHIQQTCWQLLNQTSCHQLTGEWKNISSIPSADGEDGYKLEINHPNNSPNESPTSIVKSKLLIAADGAQSAIRKWSGILSTETPYHQHCIVGNVLTEQSHQSIAWQRYHQGYAFAFLPLANGFCSIAWYVDENQSESILAKSHEQQKSMMQQASGGMLGQIEKVQQLAAFPIIRRDAQKLYGKNLLLVGDAVRSIHPMAGQGVNIGLCDVAVLGEIMAFAHQHKININEPMILQKYARQRSEYKFLQTGMDSINLLFNSPVMETIRPTMLKQLNKLTIGKQWLTQIAMGYHNHLPQRLKKLH